MEQIKYLYVFLIETSIYSLIHIISWRHIALLVSGIIALILIGAVIYVMFLTEKENEKENEDKANRKNTI